MNSKEKEVLRKKSLGELGELLAIKALVDNGFEKVMNINDIKRNFVFADLYAEKEGKKYLISVKTRNKYTKDGKLNDRYKLYDKYEKVEGAIKEFSGEPYWMAIQLDENDFSIYLGSLEELDGNKGIPINHCDQGKVGECLEKNKRHFFDHSYFCNR